jgi:hypothetical protein
LYKIIKEYKIKINLSKNIQLMIKARNGLTFTKCFCILVCLLYVARANFASTPSCYPTFPWYGSDAHGWPTKTSDTDGSAKISNYYESGTIYDDYGLVNRTKMHWVDYTWNTTYGGGTFERVQTDERCLYNTNYPLTND